MSKEGEPIVNAGNTKRALVLIVDDDPDLRTLAELQLGERFDLISADSGSGCISAAREESPDVILLDMMMPGMSGTEVLEGLAADPATRDIPVIFLSALGTTEDKVKGLEKGAVDYISKPADPHEFMARVAAAARTRARQEEIQASRHTDIVTDLPDRTAFHARLDQEMARARRLASPLAAMIIDLDNMSDINDKAGRRGGDRLLRQVAERVRDTLRASDTLYRYGGDELAALLPDSEMAAAFRAAERCRAAVAGISMAGMSITCSIGVAEAIGGRSPEELLAKAEIALFRAQESGGNRSWRADDLRKHSLHPSALAADLTEREWAILHRLADKQTEQDIARAMGIRPGTVRSHKARIRRKLNVSSEMRLNDFVREHFSDLVSRVGMVGTHGGDDDS